MADITYNDIITGSQPVGDLKQLPVRTGTRWPAYTTLAIAASASTSSSFVVPDGWRIAKITILGTWTTANLIAQSSDDNGTTWTYNTTYGDNLLIYPIAGKSICLDMDYSMRISQKMVRFVSGTSSAGTVTPVTQGTAQTLVISLMSI